MRIAIVTAYWHYPEAGYEFLSRLARLGHDVNVIIWNSMVRNIVRSTISNGFTMYKLPGINLLSILGSSYKYPYVFGLPYVIKILKPEVIDCQSHLFLTTVQAVKIAKKFNIASIVTVHGVMAKRGPIMNLGQRIYLYTLGSRIFKEATLVRCLTQKDAQEIMSYGCPQDKIRLIPNAVDTDVFRPSSNAEENLIVWTGRLVEEKGLRYLIEAMKLIVNRHRETKLMLVGDGPLKQKLISIVNRYGLLRNVIFTGALSHKQVAVILQKATLFVIPSLKEGMPFALLEAMACGKPVIGSDIPGINDVITHEENGILIPPRNPKVLANAIALLLEDKNLRRKLGQNARKLIVEKYNWNVIGKRIEEVYNEVTSTCQ
jgi:glycosyltransferase involved in cell wall biosynthesis